GRMVFRGFLGALALTMTVATAAQADDLAVRFADSEWTGDKIPAGQNCAKDGGKGATPALIVSGIPPEANAIIVEFNDKTFNKLSYDGGHGKIGFMITPGQGEVTLPSVPGGTKTVPDGVWIEKKNRATGNWYTEGYLPPCSGGAGNIYEAEVYAVVKTGDDYDEIADTDIRLGRY
ncbi:MAG: hypothetical protein P1V34_16070, partial [Alphaproteobacteria bacterium]|nr:hypothetical protein [Alphaproteobacteria bacterium]